MPGISLTATTDGFDEVVQDLSAGLSTIGAIAAVVLDYGQRLQAQAVRNVSGVQVTYSGGTFVVNRDTGFLSQNIRLTQPNPLGAMVTADTEYASYVHDGVDHPVDMKPFLMGKVIPIRARGMGDAHLAQTSVQGAALWAMPTQGPVKGGVTHKQKRNSKGRVSRNLYISFRRVTAASTGWIIPVRPPRPFLTAAVETIEPLFTAALAKTFADHINGGGP